MTFSGTHGNQRRYEVRTRDGSVWMVWATSKAEARQQFIEARRPIRKPPGGYGPEHTIQKVTDYNTGR